MNGILLLVAFSLIAIGIISVVLNQLGRSKAATITGPLEASEIIDAQLPGQSLGSVDIANGGSAALSLVGERAGVALLRAAGSKWTVRWVKPGEVKEVSSSNGDLIVKLNDFADPRVKLFFEDEVCASKWSAIFRRLSLPG